MSRSRKLPWWRDRFLAIALWAGLGGMLFGYGTGIIAGALLYLRHRFDLNADTQGLPVGLTLAGAALGALLAGPLADRWGRRPVLLLTATGFMAGSLLSASADDLATLFLGRGLLGIAIGISSTVTPLYLAEIAPAPRRGAVVTLNQLYIAGGILLSYLVAWIFSPSAHGWRWMLGLGAVPAGILALGLWRLPESPRWLCRQGRIAPAQQALNFLRAPAAAEEEWRDLQRLNEGPHRTGGSAALWRAPNLRRPLMLAIGLAIFQQVTGINVIIYFAPQIFQAAGWSSPQWAILATVGIGLVNMLALRRLDRWGRRPLLLTGLAGMLLALLSLAASAALPVPALGLGLAAAAITVYVASFAISLGPIFWLLIAELFPQTQRGTAMSVATLANWLSNLLVNGTFLSLLNVLGETSTYLLYATMTILAWLFCYLWVPETRGASLEAISAGTDPNPVP